MLLLNHSFCTDPVMGRKERLQHLQLQSDHSHICHIPEYGSFSLKITPERKDETKGNPHPPRGAQGLDKNTQTSKLLRFCSNEL